MSNKPLKIKGITDLSDMAKFWELKDEIKRTLFRAETLAGAFGFEWDLETVKKLLSKIEALDKKENVNE